MNVDVYQSARFLNLLIIFLLAKSLKLVNTTKYINQPDDSDEDPFATDGDSDPDFPDLNSSDSD